MTKISAAIQSMALALAWAPMWGSVSRAAEGPPPSGLMVELLKGEQAGAISDPSPEFTWVVESSQPNDIQSAYQILVASHPEKLTPGEADLWDSSKTTSPQSIHVPYRGRPLEPLQSCFWKVRTWCQRGGASEWSSVHRFQTSGDLGTYSTPGRPLVKTVIPPTAFVRRSAGQYFVDFGRAAAGTVRLTLSATQAGGKVIVQLGEKTSGPHSVDSNPGGSIRHQKIEFALKQGTHVYEVEVPPHQYNLPERTLTMPEEIGEVVPFRYCQLTNVPEPFEPEQIQQVAVHYPFDDSASAFVSDNDVLNRVWELCRYTIKATSYCGLYIDGDRERFPREADAYINQLGHYCVDREYSLGRRTHEFMMTHTSQWTEWMMHSVIMAWTDHLYTGNKDSLEFYYEDLKHKTLIALARKDGLISTRTGKVDDNLRKALHYFKGGHVKGRQIRDIVDWPQSERDDYQFTDINTVVNAFHYRSLILMEAIARALDKPDDAGMFARRAELVRESFNGKLFNSTTGLYVDGEGSRHSSLHANMFPLALGLVPDDRKHSIVRFLRSKGMACSVYGAQYLLEGLYLSGEDQYALELITSTDVRSWNHMLDVGSTITTEAWDLKFKDNLDWTHAWGAAPANLIPRHILGVQPLEPGFARILIQPKPGNLKDASGVVPTIRGPVSVDFTQSPDAFTLTLSIPANSTAVVALPRKNMKSHAIFVDGKPLAAEVKDNYLFIDNIGSGSHTLISR